MYQNSKFDIPKLATEQMIEVDYLMIEDYGIIPIQMMENAGRCLARLAMDRFLPRTILSALTERFKVTIFFHSFSGPRWL